MNHGCPGRTRESFLVPSLPGLAWRLYATPGTSPIDPADRLNKAGVPSDLIGKRALDIGAWDGPIAFEIEARGAEVTVLDIQDPDCTGFNIAKKLRNSCVRYVRADVYQLTECVDGTFDIVCFYGVYYHLKAPVIAFEQISRVMEPGGILSFEGECLLRYLETTDGRPCSTVDTELVEEIARSDIPLCAVYPGQFKEASNWFVPNLAALRSILKASGFSLEQYILLGSKRNPKTQQIKGLLKGRLKQPGAFESEENPKMQRILGWAVKTANPIQEHPIFQTPHWRQR